LLNNYKQALDILKSGPQALAQAMADLQISDYSVFEIWLTEEKEYLQGLRKEPEEETLHMEYWQKLVNLQGSELSVPLRQYTIHTDVAIPQERSCCIYEYMDIHNSC
jgi:hypothetical protein